MQKRATRHNTVRWQPIVIIALALASLVVWSLAWKGDPYYSGAYREVIRPGSLPSAGSGSDSASSSSDSVEPRIMGLKEKEVRKNKGNGFSVY